MGLLSRTLYSQEKIVGRLSRYLNYLATGALMAMVLLLSINIIIRIFYKSLTGVYELVGLMTAILVSFAVAHTQAKKRHIWIPIVYSRLRHRVQVVLSCISYFLSIGVAWVITWQSVLLANTMRRQGEISGVLPIPTFIFVFGLAFGFAILGLVFLIDFINLLTGKVRK